MKYLLLFLLATMNFSCSSASDNETTVTNEKNMNNQQKLNYDSTILATMKEVVDLTSSSSVFGVKGFISLYENPSLYQSDAIAFLENERYSEEEKSIAVFTMQKSDLEGYLVFFRRVVKLFNDEKITEGILSEVISSSVNTKYIVIRNYRNKDVSGILNGLKTNEKISIELKERIENILSGKSWKSVSKHL